VTGVAEGVDYQKKINAEASNETRMVKFYMDVFCDAKEISGCTIVLKHDKVWLWPKDPSAELPKNLKDDSVPHPFTGFYIMYPDEDRSPPERGLVSTISVDPPMLNWIYVDKDTLEVKYSNRSGSVEHIIGPWDWTEDETGVTLEDWEGFVAVEEEERPDGLKWALYYDRWDDDFGNGRLLKGKGKTRLQCSLERRLLPEEVRKAQDEAQNRKLQMKQEGNLGQQSSTVKRG